jgi:RHS repeat-associated protein
VAALSNNNNQIVERYSYDVFGEPNTTSSVGNPYMFTGRRLDTETGNYYYRARYYNPDIGRFLQTDPIGYDDGLNMYTGFSNNPTNMVDPWGLAPNQAGVTDPSHVLQSLKNDPDLTNLRDTHTGNTNRYFYTEKYGWVDIRHFAESARRAQESPSWWVKIQGVGNEVYQWLTEWGDDYRSGFSPEDLPSNSAGVNFGSTYLRHLPADKAFEQWMKAAKAQNLNDIASIVQALPKTDPSVRGGKDRGSSNISSELKK